jgi:hypothetical protein
MDASRVRAEESAGDTVLLCYRRRTVFGCSIGSEISVLPDLEILHLGLTPQRAKDFFSFSVGPLSGVSTAALAPDVNEFDGTQDVFYLYQVWDSLTAEQRRAADALIRVPPEAGRGRAGALAISLFTPPRPGIVLASFSPAIDDEPAHD